MRLETQAVHAGTGVDPHSVAVVEPITMFRRVAGRPGLPCTDLAAQRRRMMSRCQRRIVSGVTSSRSP
jgi:hypothetical protein